MLGGSENIQKNLVHPYCGMAPKNVLPSSQRTRLPTTTAFRCASLSEGAASAARETILSHRHGLGVVAEAYYASSNILIKRELSISTPRNLTSKTFGSGNPTNVLSIMR